MHLVGWKDFEIKKSIDLIDILNIYLSPDMQNFWGSQRPEVMSWMPITMYLSEYSGNVLGRKVEEDEELFFEDSSVSDYKHKGPVKLTYLMNLRKQTIYGCDLHKMDDAVDSNEFFVVCMLSAEVSPFLMFKMKADTLSIIPMTLREMRNVARKLDKMLGFSHYESMTNKSGFPFEVYTEEEKPKPHKFLNKAIFDSVDGLISGTDFNKNKIWNVKLERGRKIIRVIRSKLEEGDVTNTNMVSGNLVLQRVNDANIVLTLFIEKPMDSSDDNQDMHLNLMVVEIVTGQVLKNISLTIINKNQMLFIQRNLKVFIIDQVYYIQVKTSPTSDVQIFSIAIFRRAIQHDILQIIKNYFRKVTSTPMLDHLAEDPETVILDRKFTLPKNTKVLGFSKTRGDVTQKSLFVSTHTGEVFAIPQIMLSPQRMTQKQKNAKAKHVENGTLHYTKRDFELQYLMDSYPLYEDSELDLHVGLSVSRKWKLGYIDNFVSEPTFLESTSLVLMTGDDWFGLRYYPEGLFDRVNPEFKKTLLILGIVGIFVLILASKFYGSTGMAQKRYMNQDE
jgi:hypothetical protein